MRTVRRLRGVVGLGLRTIRGRAGSLGPALAAITGIALATFVVLALLSARNVADGYRDRITARSPVESTSVADAVFTRTVAKVGQRMLTVFAVAGDTDPPPGLDEFPRPGQIYASPALVDEATRNPDLAELLTGRDVRQIGPIGLTDPGELLAWVGVDRGELVNPSGLRGFGTSDALPPYLRETGWMVFLGASAAAVLLVPLALIAGAAGRVNASLRERRLAALRFLGLSRFRAALIPLTELSILAFVGASAGAVVFGLASGVIGDGPVFGVSFFPEDARLTVSTVGSVVAFVSLYTVAVGFLPTLRAVATPTTTRPSLAVRRARRWPMVILVATLLLLTLLAALPEDWAVAAQAGGLYLIQLGFVVGLVGGLSSLVGWVASKTARRATRVETLLAARRLEVDPGSATRYLLGLAVMLFAVIAVGAFLDGLSGAPQFEAEVRAQQYAGGKQLVRVEHVPPGRDLREALGSADVVRAVLPVVDGYDAASGEERSPVLLADCPSLRELARIDIAACPEGPVLIPEPEFGGFVGPDLPEPDPGMSVTFQGAGGEEVTVIPTGFLDLGLEPIDVAGGMVAVDPRAVGIDPGDVDAVEYIAVLDPSPEAAERFALRLLGAAPGSRLFVPGEAGISGSRELSWVSRYLGILLALGAVLVFVSVAVVGLQLTVGRPTRALVAIGAPTRVLRRVEMLILMFPAVVGLTIAIGGGFAMSLAAGKTLGVKASLGRPLVVYVVALGASGLLAALGARRVTQAGDSVFEGED